MDRSPKRRATRAIKSFLTILVRFACDANEKAASVQPFAQKFGVLHKDDGIAEKAAGVFPENRSAGFAGRPNAKGTRRSGISDFAQSRNADGAADELKNRVGRKSIRNPKSK
ncbi:MAG TPA: hypothetical protein VIL74_11280 [Pyrinomonadaceae bacterium]|jgi:hypothetical protein